jgi:hypothetical protein
MMNKIINQTEDSQALDLAKTIYDVYGHCKVARWHDCAPCCVCGKTSNDLKVNLGENL